jgi:hypothetical protein
MSTGRTHAIGGPRWIARLVVSCQRTRLSEVNPVVRSCNEWADPKDALVAQITAAEHVVVLDTPDTAEA